jgi:hypothetical protein
MTTLLLRPEEIAQLRVLKGLAYMLAVMITLDRHYPGAAFRPDQIARVAGMDERTASRQLQDLSTLDRVVLTTSGYVLTQGGRALFLAPANDEALALSPDNSQALPPKAQAHSTHTISVSDNSAVSDAKNHTHCVCALEEVEESSSLRFKDSSTTILKSANNLLTTKNILAHSAILFGEPGVVTARLDLDAIAPHFALGWMAQAYDQRCKPDYPRGLQAPAGLVYARLRDIEQPKPREQYYVAPEKYLPDEYLETLGLVDYSCTACSETFASNAELEKHESLMLICEHDCEARFHSIGELDAHIASAHTVEAADVQLLASDHPCYAAWEQVCSQLQTEMPRASFETWVRDIQPVQYTDHVLTVAVRNAYARDWLESRLQEKVDQMLSEILHTQVCVRFVVANATDGQDDD